MTVRAFNMQTYAAMRTYDLQDVSIEVIPFSKRPRPRGQGQDRRERTLALSRSLRRERGFSFRSMPTAKCRRLERTRGGGLGKTSMRRVIRYLQIGAGPRRFPLACSQDICEKRPALLKESSVFSRIFSAAGSSLSGTPLRTACLSAIPVRSTS